MKTTMFIPETIKAGFRKNSYSFTKKEAFLLAMNENGKYRELKSFQNMIDPRIGTEEFQNIPVKGFQLNRSTVNFPRPWHQRNKSALIYDPRGFEMEITFENLLYILEHTKQMEEEEFVYGWFGSVVTLLPINSYEYKEVMEKKKKMEALPVITAKNLVVGATYLFEDDTKMVYLGKFHEYETYDVPYRVYAKSKKQFYFGSLRKNVSGESQFNILRVAKIESLLTEQLEEKKHVHFDEIMDYLEGQNYYSPIDNTKTIVEDMPFEYFENLMKRRTENWTKRASLISICAMNGQTHYIRSMETNPTKEFYFVGCRETVRNMYNDKVYEVSDYKDIFNILKPSLTHYYQKNGRHYETVSHPFT